MKPQRITVVRTFSYFLGHGSRFFGEFTLHKLQYVLMVTTSTTTTLSRTQKYFLVCTLVNIIYNIKPWSTTNTRLCTQELVWILCPSRWRCMRYFFEISEEASIGCCWPYWYTLLHHVSTTLHKLIVNILYLATCKIAREQQHGLGSISSSNERGAEFPSWKLAALFTCEYYIPFHRYCLIIYIYFISYNLQYYYINHY